MLRPPCPSRSRAGRPTAAIAATVAAAPLLLLGAHAARAADLSLGAVTGSALPGCDNPTPVRAPDGGIFSNVSDCAVGGSGKISTGWVRLEPKVGFVPSSLTTKGDGAKGRKLSGAVVDGGTAFVLERNVSGSGTGTRVGWSSDFDESRPNFRWASWTMPDLGWGSFAQSSPDGYQYAYFRDSKSAYGSADRVVLARAPKGKLGDLGSWQAFTGTASKPAWGPWSNRGARKPVLSDSGKINRPHVTYLKGCWTMAVTMPPRGKERGGSGLAVYTSGEPYGPWKRRYYASGTNLGESAQFSPLYPGKLLLTHDDRFEWRRYSLSGGC